ncbi:protein-glutamate methylesterase/protein-glutamine glutaminase [Aquibium microcysteis]|uniref:protein-glutamate methylesterase/protein-glutamine glutaminase n=1 Tax=Aquibium microcysteis TaxID=675281 RepID=UPI00165CF4AE|nr:chemotaxis response regulator protein-glutamate methylesterase [Aquibium microcysteis]
MTDRTARAGRKTRVLIVDDSASVRQTLSDIISSDPALEVMATAPDPYAAAERIRQEVPDVIFLDIEMPKMDGLTFLRKIMAQRPIPVVICSSLTESGSDALLQALEGGAVDVVTKPRVGSIEFLQMSRMQICDVAKAAAQARPRGPRPKPVAVERKLTADAVLPPVRVSPGRAMPDIGTRIVCIGASTGGTEALRDVLEALPADAPPIVIVQHMPEKFTAAFARRLDSLCAISVKEAADGDDVVAGRALVAPGNRHMILQRIGARFRVSIADGPPVCRHRPSVDVLFRSAAQAAGANAVGVIMTGMGDDGAQGLLEMKTAGAFTLAQDEDSCVVFGMPREAIERGAASKVVPLQKIAGEILTAAHATTPARAR